MENPNLVPPKTFTLISHLALDANIPLHPPAGPYIRDDDSAIFTVVENPLTGLTGTTYGVKVVNGMYVLVPSDIPNEKGMCLVLCNREFDANGDAPALTVERCGGDLRILHTTTYFRLLLVSCQNGPVSYSQDKDPVTRDWYRYENGSWSVLNENQHRAKLAEDAAKNGEGSWLE